MNFLVLFFCLVVNNNSCGKSFPLKILKLIYRVVPVLSLTADFNFFSCVSDNLTFTLLCSTIYINCKTFIFPFANSNIVSFDFSRIGYSLIFVPAASSTTPLNTIC